MDLGKMLVKLSSFSQLTSLTILGSFSLLNEQLEFSLPNLKFLCLGESKITFDLEQLLSQMPNLIELRLEGKSSQGLKLQNPIGIRYFTSKETNHNHYRDFINVIKSTPNLIQLTLKDTCSKIQIVRYATELAYYFKELKGHFNSELQFEINPNSFPIKQLKNDSELLKLVRLKSSELQNYLKSIFPIDISESFVKQLFTIEIEKYFNIKSIGNELVKRFFNLLSELEIEREEDISFLKKLLLKGDEYFTESTDFSSDNFYELFLKYLVESIEINLESTQKEFVKKFHNASKKYGPFKIYNFLKSFFTSLLVEDGTSKIIYNEIFDFFSSHLLNDSFEELFNQIKEIESSKMEEDVRKMKMEIKKENEENEEKEKKEKKSLSSQLKSIAEDLKNLETEKYKALSAGFKDILMDVCDEWFAKGLFYVLKVILIPETKCELCFGSLFNEECKLFKFEKGNCHLFHKDCLNRCLKEECPHCRRTIDSPDCILDE